MRQGLETFAAPAKLNLFLHVIGRRPDGYHLLQTAFVLVDWCDDLSFAVRADGCIVRQTPFDDVPEDQDLCVRAARLLQAHTNCSFGADIYLNKNLPMGGGLGGGSSDAATTLVALNAMWRTGLSAQQLQQLGLQLGADVPFFIFGRPAFAQGIGEVFEPLEVPQAWYVIVHPGVHVPTNKIFMAEDLTRNTKPIKISDFAIHTTRNDLQPVVMARYRAVSEAMGWLAQYGLARMTGSGACVFAQVTSEEQADAIVNACPEVWLAKKARGLSRHPLYHLAHSSKTDFLGSRQVGQGTGF